MIVRNRLLNFSDNIIYQNEDYFAFSLDSVLLANFVTIKLSDKKILDLCTGNAPIPMLMSFRTKARIFGVELQKEIYSATETSISSYSYDEFARIQKVEYKDSLYDFQYKDIPHQNTFIRYTYVNNKLTSTTTITKTDFGYEMNIKDEKTKFPELYRYFYEDEKLTKVEIDYSFQDSIIPSHIFEYKYLPSGMVARETVYLPDGETIYNYKEQKEIDSTIEILIQDNNIYAPSESKIILSEIDASGNWHYGVEIQDGKIINTYKRDIIYTNDIVSEL